MMPRSRRVLLASLIGVPAAGAILAAAPALQPQPAGERVGGRDRAYAAWIPPGEYTAIVLCSSGEDRRWAVSLTTNTVGVPIVVRPGEDVVIPFERGWRVNASDEAHIASRLVPFDDAAKYNLVGERPDFVLSAWGITETGPVQFVYREMK